MNEWKIYPTRSELDEALAGHLAAALSADLTTQPRSSIALSGGSTPKDMFRCLSAADLDWPRVDVTLVDERWVDYDHPDSNAELVRSCLLQGPAASAHFLGLKTATPDINAAVPAVSEALAGLQRPFTAVVLGMGGDGHTASWFPQATNLAQLLDLNNSARVAATDPVTAPHLRMTLTLAAVLDSHHIHLHLTGADKRAVLESAVATGYPVASILTQTVTPVTIWWAP
ncbi:MAG TPA: 6-phosphogluconolactonase [Kineobactrum sp.]